MSDARSHLSIGEVLSLLQDEFPDITISKIRFLESQGLLNPERTPSGYRKFYDPDVEQLRWVLRQQKDNFLPLKVIKDRLAAGQLDAPASDSGLLDLAPAEPVIAASATVGSRVASIAEAPPGASESRPNPSDTRPTADPGPRREAGGTQERGEEDGAAANTPAGPTVPSPTQRARRASEAPAPRSNGSDPSGTPGPRTVMAMSSSMSLTADELCAATGASRRLLADLEQFGLVHGRPLGTDTVYDDDAVVICRLAASMANAGLEARHLRMFKVSAEREAGLYEQLALPRLRAQRPEARQEAVAQVTALTASAAELHAALLRRALRDSIGPL